MIRIARERRRFKSSNQRLRRARRLYLFRLRLWLVTPEWLFWVSDRMRATGLYNETKSNKDTAWGILRYLYKFDAREDPRYQGFDGWHRWVEDKGWLFMFRDWRDGRPRTAA